MFDVSSLNLTIPQKPRGNKILVLPLVQAGLGFLIDAEDNREHPEKGLVLKVGPGAVAVESGRAIPVESRVGELVAYGKYAGQKWEVDGPAAADGRRQPVTVFIMSDSEVMLSQDASELDLVVHDGDPRKIHERGRTCEFCPRETGEAGLDRLRAIAAGDDPDAAIEAERRRASALITQ